jgi:hypothetical protein
MTTGMREVRLPEALCASAEQKFRSHFGNLEELLVFVLNNLLTDESSRMDEAEQEIIDQRLKELGYL